MSNTVKLSTLNSGQKFRFPEVVDNRTAEQKKAESDYVENILLEKGINVREHEILLTDEQWAASEKWMRGLFMKPHHTVQFMDRQCTAICLDDGKPYYSSSDDIDVLVVD